MTEPQAAQWAEFRRKMIMRGLSSAETDRMQIAFLAGVGARARVNRSPKNPPRKYTAKDIERIERMRAAGNSLSEIAQALGRTVGSIKGTRWYYMVAKEISNAA